MEIILDTERLHFGEKTLKYRRENQQEEEHTQMGILYNDSQYREMPALVFMDVIEEEYNNIGSASTEVQVWRCFMHFAYSCTSDLG